jgi:hypothetical protein
MWPQYSFSFFFSRLASLALSVDFESFDFFLFF